MRKSKKTSLSFTKVENGAFMLCQPLVDHLLKTTYQAIYNFD